MDTIQPCRSCELDNLLYDNEVYFSASLDRRLPDGSKVKVLSESNVPVPDGYYGEYERGTTFEVWVILEWYDKDNNLIGTFKKMGRGDSYGSITYGGPVKPVVKVEKSITVYEYQ